MIFVKFVHFSRQCIGIVCTVDGIIRCCKQGSCKSVQFSKQFSSSDVTIVGIFIIVLLTCIPLITFIDFGKSHGNLIRWGWEVV